MRTTVIALSGLALVLFACSSESPTGASRSNQTTQKNGSADDEDTSGKSSKTGTPSNSQSTDPTDPAADPAAGGQCGSQAKAEACFDCCDPSKAAFEAADKAFGDCICAAAKCGTQCAQTACNMANPTEPQQGDACDTCLQQNVDACDQVAGDVCDKDANCKKASDCVEAAKCFEKAQ